MKFYKLIFLIFLMMFCACDNLLDVEPKSAISSKQFYKTKADAIAAVNSVYALLNKGWDTYWRGLYLTGELTTDNGSIKRSDANNPKIHELANYTFGPVNGRIDVVYQRSYTIINRANAAIKHIPNIDMDGNIKNRLIGEAKFVRALMYFNLVRLFGDIPLVTKETTNLQDLNVKRTSVDSVYSQIENDLNFAKQNLNATTEESGRATSIAASGLLAKVYLEQKDWEKTKQNAKIVMGNGNYGLMQDYADVFRPATENNKEILFSIQYKVNTGNNGFGIQLMLPRNVIPGVPCCRADVPSKEFYNSFRNGDLRRDWTFFTSYTEGGTTYNFDGPYWHKYFDPNYVNKTDANFPVIRYADILLIYAEAENELNDGPTQDAYSAINKVVRRAYGDDINNNSSSHNIAAGLSQEAFREEVWHQRRWEFGCEDQRWFTLKRTGRLKKIMTPFLQNYRQATYHDYNNLFPIPQREIDTNPNLTQNPGY